VHIAAAGNELHLVWEDARFGLANMHYQRSRDEGATRWGECAPYSDQRLDMGALAGRSNSSSPELALAGSHVYVVFENDRNLRPDVFFARSVNVGATWQEGPDDGDILLQASSDGGFTWRP